MRKQASIGLLIACYAGVSAYAAWALYKGSAGGGWASVLRVWPYLLAGVLTVAGVTALFVWLAFYSDRRGYDDRVDLDKHWPHLAAGVRRRRSPQKRR